MDEWMDGWIDLYIYTSVHIYVYKYLGMYICIYIYSVLVINTLGSCPEVSAVLHYDRFFED